ncbi:MAG: iron-containing alcohol dehydrogenase, partial [Terrabacter sp.]|nr:iron-containing alcohol dehydrogenase [Terrabacter sp.]
MATAATVSTLVVGAGQAGISLVTALRELGDRQPVVLVGAEPEPPYERPPLSKSYLRGEHDRGSLVFHDAAWFADLGVELVTGDPVVSIGRDTSGGSATTASGRTLAFERLALTTGAVNRGLGVEVVVHDSAHVEPTDASLLAAVERARADGPFDGYVAVGGGSAIDTAKAVDLLLSDGGELMDYVNAPVGAGRAPTRPLAPLVAV